MSETNLSDELTNILQGLTQSDESSSLISQIDNETLLIETEVYKIVTNYREGFDLEAFKQRYQPFFEKFDFIVGDWGHEQLRLRGFYQINTSGVPYDQTIDLLEDYLIEYCNFGARYFVIGKEAAVEAYDQLYEKALNKTLQKASRHSNRTKQSKTVNTRKEIHTKGPKKKKHSEELAKKNRSPYKIKQVKKEQEKRAQKTMKKQSKFVIRKQQMD